MNINGTLIVEGISRLQYKVDFFKLHDDSYLLDQFEELFERSSPTNPNQSISEGKWILNEVRIQINDFLCTKR